MTEVPGGRFCSQCSKVVVDFTSLTDEEAASLLAQRKPGQRLCGRVNPGQLKRISPQVRKLATAPVQRKSYRLVPMVLLGMMAIQAQAPLVPAQAPTRTEWTTLPNQPLPPLLPGDFPVNIELRDFHSKALINRPLQVLVTLPNGKEEEHLVKNGRLSFVARGYEAHEIIQVMVTESDASEEVREMAYFHSMVGKPLSEAKRWVIEMQELVESVPEMGDVIDPWEEYR